MFKKQWLSFHSHLNICKNNCLKPLNQTFSHQKWFISPWQIKLVLLFQFVRLFNIYKLSKKHILDLYVWEIQAAVIGWIPNYSLFTEYHYSNPFLVWNVCCVFLQYSNTRGLLFTNTIWQILSYMDDVKCILEEGGCTLETYCYTNTPYNSISYFFDP